MSLPARRDRERRQRRRVRVRRRRATGSRTRSTRATSSATACSCATCSTDVVRSLDSERALYRRLAWADSAAGARRAARRRRQRPRATRAYAIVSFAGVGGAAPRSTVFDAKAARRLPGGDAGRRRPRAALRRGPVGGVLRHPRGEQPPRRTSADAATATRRRSCRPGAPGAGGTINQPRRGAEPTTRRRRSCSGTRRTRASSRSRSCRSSADRAFNYLAAYRLAENKFVRLADDELRNVTPFAARPVRRTAPTIARLPAGGELQRPQLLRRLRHRPARPARGSAAAQEAARRRAMVPSPDGTRALYWGTDGHWYVARPRDRRRRANITKGVAASFADDEDDHNNLFPPSHAAVRLERRTARPCCSPTAGTSWKVPVDGGAAVEPHRRRPQGAGALPAAVRVRRARRAGVGAGAASATRAGDRPREAALPRARTASGRRRKGSRAWTPRQRRRDAARVGRRELQRSRRRAMPTSYVFTRQTFTEFPNYWVRERGPQARRASSPTRTRSRATFAWSSGARLIELRERQGRQAAGRAVPAGELRAGQEVPDARDDLREALAEPERVREPERDAHAEPERSTRAAATSCSIRTSSTRSTIRACRRCGAWCRR